MTVKAVFLDRDGVLNRNDVRGGRPYAPTEYADFEILPGVPEAVAALKAAGFLAIVATNQPDIETGKQTPETLAEMHQALRKMVPVDDIKICYHTDAAACDCRKPKPGLLLEAARQYGIDLSASYMIGDRWRDVAAGQAAGCATIFVDYGYDEPRPQGPDAIVKTLTEAAAWILDRERGHKK